MKPRLSVVVPAYNEGTAITRTLDSIFDSVSESVEVLVVFDVPEDTTRRVLEEYARDEPRLRPTLNTYGRGPARAIRFGIDHATADVVVVTMADASDDVSQIESLARLVEDGCVVAAASRYMPGGRQLGGPRLKRTLSRLAGLSLWYLGRVGTHDATNSFKAYSKRFVTSVGIESDAGFELGLELVAKARRHRLPVGEVPTMWRDRTEGQSQFALRRWLPLYLKWYVHAFGPPIDPPAVPQQEVSR